MAQTAAERKRAQRERDKKKMYDEVCNKATKSVSLSKSAYYTLARNAKLLDCTLSDVILALNLSVVASHLLNCFAKKENPDETDILHTALNLVYEQRANEKKEKKPEQLLKPVKLSEL